MVRGNKYVETGFQDICLTICFILSQSNHQDSQNQTDSRDRGRTGASQADGDRESVAVLTNTAINNCNQVFSGVKFLRCGIDSLYLSYQGELSSEVGTKLKALKAIAQSASDKKLIFHK